MPKETFKDMLAVNEDVQIFSGNPREPGILGRAYFAAFEDNAYIISYIDWDYNEEERRVEIVETFSNYDDFWNYLITMMEDDDYFPEYNFTSEPSSALNEAFKQKMTKEQFKQHFSKFTYEVPLFRTRKGGFMGTYYCANLTLDGINITVQSPSSYFNMPKVMWKGMEATIMPQVIGTLPNFDALWDYIIKMVSDKKNYVGEYDYIDPRLNESLTELKKKEILTL
jgi:hypothetical protein